MDLVVGVGEIGLGLTKLFEKCGRPVCGFDSNPKLCFGKPKDIELMHVCFPFSENFIKAVEDYYRKWKPGGVVIHSTMKPGSTKMLHDRIVGGNAIYSPVRGVHSRLLLDLGRYTKFYSFYPKTDSSLFEECFEGDCGLRIERFSSPFALELAKIVMDTSYYGWIIVYGQLVDKLCKRHDLDYDELWKFAEEIHKFLRNRPKTYVDPKGIGGHCVIPNLNLIEDYLPELKEIIVKINEETKNRHR